MCKWLILSVKVRMAILGKAPGIAIYCHCENLYPHFRRDVSDAAS